MSGINCTYNVTFYVKCAHARIDITHSNICFDSKIREKIPIDEVCNKTGAGNPWITHIFDNHADLEEPAEGEEEVRPLKLCICGEDLEPNTIFAVENTYCGERKCQLDKRFVRTPEQRLDAKLYFQIKLRLQELERPEHQRWQEFEDEAERDLNKAKYKRALAANQNKEHFHVLDMRKYPKNAEQILTNFLVPVPPPDDNCVVCFYPLVDTKNGEAVELPCKHTYHRNCIIESLIHKKHCGLCDKDYEIFLFNGFDRTVYATSIVSIDDRHEPDWCQPFRVIVAGYIPHGALADKDERTHIKFLTKQKLDDKWGDNNGNSVKKEEAKFKKEQEERTNKWRGNFLYHMDLLDKNLGEETEAENELRQFLREPRYNSESPDTLNRLVDNLEAKRRQREALEPAPVLDSLGYQFIIEDRTDLETAQWFEDWVEKGRRTEARLIQAEARSGDLLFEAYGRLQEWGAIG